MSRWTQWARELRARHGRWESRSAGAGMEFEHRMRAHANLAQTTHTHVSVSVHPRFGFSFRPAGITMPRPAGVTMRVHPAPPISTQIQKAVTTLRQPLPGVAIPSESHTLAMHERSAFNFITASSLFETRRNAERRFEQLHELVRARARIRESASTVVAIPSILRERMKRIELLSIQPGRLALASRHLPEPKANDDNTRSHETTTTMSNIYGQPVPSAPPADINTLTSQVIRQLDSRLIAYRERMGRS